MELKSKMLHVKRLLINEIINSGSKFYVLSSMYDLRILISQQKRKTNVQLTPLAFFPAD